MKSDALLLAQVELEKSFIREETLRNEFNEAINRYEKEAKDLRVELDEILIKLSQAEQEIAKQIDTNKDLEKRLSKLSNENDRLDSELIKVRHQVQSLKAEKGKMEARVNEAKQAVAQKDLMQDKYERLCQEVLYYLQVSNPTLAYDAKRIHLLIDIAVKNSCSLGKAENSHQIQ